MSQPKEASLVALLLEQGHQARKITIVMELEPIEPGGEPIVAEAEIGPGQVEFRMDAELIPAAADVSEAGDNPPIIISRRATTRSVVRLEAHPFSGQHTDATLRVRDQAAETREFLESRGIKPGISPDPETAEEEGYWLEGYDTFSSETYPIYVEDFVEADGYEYKPSYPDLASALEAARHRLAFLERTQPSATSGGQGQSGIQDRVFVVHPDGTRQRVHPGSS